MRLHLPVRHTPASRPPVGVLNIAHRGASSEAPENTLAAVRRAVVVGADLVELDVQRSADGALVLMHDATLARTTDAPRVFPRRAPWRVADFTLAELRRLDAGSWKSVEYAGERVPTLREVIDLLRLSRSGLLLEVKSPQLYPGIVDDVVAELQDVPGFVEAAVGQGRLVVQSFDYVAMKAHKTRLPAVPVGLLGAPAREHLPVLGSWADQVNPSHLAVSRAYVQAVRQSGLTCLGWTVDSAYAMRRALRLGFDGVITNRPSALALLMETHGTS